MKLTDSGNADPKVSSLLGGRVRAARRDARMSQRELAKAMNTTQSAVSLYEAGARSIGLDLLLDIARVLDRPLDYFLGSDAGGVMFRRGGQMAELISDLEQHPEDLPDLLLYRQYLRSKATRPTEPLKSPRRQPPR
jgi:transcriptional regulator with XRE-family HTH domain